MLGGNGQEGALAGVRVSWYAVLRLGCGIIHRWEVWGYKGTPEGSAANSREAGLHKQGVKPPQSLQGVRTLVNSSGSIGSNATGETSGIHRVQPQLLLSRSVAKYKLVVSCDTYVVHVVHVSTAKLLPGSLVSLSSLYITRSSCWRPTGLQGRNTRKG